MADLTMEAAEAMHNACRYRQNDWEPGSTEPWVIDTVAALLVASGQRAVLELGGYKAACSRALAHTLRLMGGGHLVVVERDPDILPILRERLVPFAGDGVQVDLLEMDVLEAIQGLPDQSVGFVWLDDDHDTCHVVREVSLLLPKMVDGGLICFHDVMGHYNLRVVVEAFGGYCLDLPRVSSSGGLGILQVRPATRTRVVRTTETGEALLPGETVVTPLTLFGSPGDNTLHYAAVEG